MRPAPDLGIRIRGLTKAFGPHRALDGVDLDVPAGSYAAVMGANGAGKTTLLKLIAGLAVPTSGSVTVAGVEMRRASGNLRRLIGVVGHESMLYPDLSGRENLLFNARLFGVPEPGAAVDRVSALMDVDAALDRPVRSLSRGTRQRVALARALVHEPALLLLDEPFTGLDEAAAASLADLLERLHTPQRLVVVTVHDVARAISGPERLIALSSGRVALDVPTREPGQDVAATYLSLLREEARR